MAQGITASTDSFFSHSSSPGNGSGLGLRDPTQSLLIGITPGRKEQLPWRRREEPQLLSTKQPQRENQSAIFHREKAKQRLPDLPESR